MKIVLLAVVLAHFFLTNAQNLMPTAVAHATVDKPMQIHHYVVHTLQGNLPFDLGGNFKLEAIANKCRPPFEFVAGCCIMVDFTQKLTWFKARIYCQERGSDLVVFKDANTFEALIQHLKATSPAQKPISVWMGGSDIQQEDYWLWIDGKPMPRGSPYWGTLGGYVSEPGGKTTENCAMFYQADHYYIHDLACEPGGNWVVVPMCQYFL